VNVVILAAGGCSRFGRPHPKALTTLTDGRTILDRQLDLLNGVFHGAAVISIVVGYQAALVMEAAARRASFVYSEDFAHTNTARSLGRALEVIGGEGVLWLNGDVVFEPGLLAHLAAFVDREDPFVAVRRGPVGEEEVKYLLDDRGLVRAISKSVAGSPGEAVGINYVPAACRTAFAAELARCADDDYFERAIETSAAAGVRFRAVDVTGYGCVEVDFESDLAAADQVVLASAMPSFGG
jgi:choline kinase